MNILHIFLRWVSSFFRLITGRAINPVFDNGPWNIPGGADHLISRFDYLNSSDRLEAARVREKIEEMFSRYPRSERERLRARLRTIDDTNHTAASFELILYQLLLNSGCRIIEVEPVVAGTNRSPDFLAETRDGDRFYLEATLATGRSQADAGADRRLREALQVIDNIPSPDFFLDLHIRGMPTAPVSGRRLRAQLQSWLGTLDYAVVSTLWETNHEVREFFTYEQHGVRFRIGAIPRRRRGPSDRGPAIATRMLNPITVQPQIPVREAILGKAQRYGDLTLPYIIAVNALSNYAAEEDAIDAVFGDPIVNIIRTDTGLEDRPGRAENGVWGNARNQTYTRVSAVLSTERLDAWSLGQARARLIMNPWARRPLAASPFNVDIVAVNENILSHTEGSSIQQIFELPEGWPEDANR